MGPRWYQSTSNQAALIGGFALIIVALIGGLFALRGRSPYPVLEVKDLTPAGEHVLARLAISPSKQLLDSSAFAALSRDNLLWNDSLGVAIRKPASFEWGTSSSDSLEDASLSDGAFLHWLFTQLRAGFGQATFEGNVRFYSVRLDQPTTIILTASSLIDSTVLGVNPFKDAAYFVRWMRTNYGASLAAIPIDSLALAQRELIAELDSVTKSYYPLTRRLLTGVFVARVGVAELPTGMTPWTQVPLLDRALGAVAVGSPTLLIVDRDRHTALFSVSTQIRNVLLNGRQTPDVTLNRAGYAVERGKAVYVVMLQYLSSQPKPVLDELQRILESVRIRARAN